MTETNVNFINFLYICLLRRFYAVQQRVPR